MYRGSESDYTQAKRRHIRENVCAFGSLDSSPQPRSSRFSAKPSMKRESPHYIRSDNGSVPRSKATTCEAIYRSSSAAVVVRQKHQDDLYRPGQSLATERSETPQRAIARIINGLIEPFHNRLPDVPRNVVTT